jgi:predicted HicB family RNase H-like nuclease
MGGKMRKNLMTKKPKKFLAFLVTEDLYKKLKEEAQKQEVSMNWLLNHILKKFLLGGH